MWSRTVILIYAVNLYLVSGYESKVFDVTTIYNIGDLHENSTGTGLTGRVQSRTNALGLPLYNGNDSRDKSVKPNITCDSIENICSWTLKDWLLIPSSLPSYNFDLQKEHFINIQKSYTFKLRVEDDQEFNITLLLSPESRLEDCKGYHDIFISRMLGRLTVKHRFCSCDISNEQLIGMVYDPRRGHRNMYCQQYDEYLSTTRTFKIKLEDGELSSIKSKPKIKRWTYLKNINYLYVKGDYNNKAIKLVLDTASGMVYTSRRNSEDSEMESPVITPEDGKLCLALVFHVPSYTEKAVLDIFSEDLSSERHLLYSVKQVLSGWNIKHVNINFPNAGPIKLVIKKTNDAEIKIARVSSCSCDGNEVEVISSVQLGLDGLPQLAAENKYTVTAYAIEPADQEEPNKSTSCMNGGVWTSDGCACPPGFYGTTCQSGCGRNRFGQDCGGLCSLRRKECQGLLMCTYSTGCHCAPGYQGPNCLEKCSNGYYGNNCQQQCGHCADGSACNKYTGECSSCEFGYLPPHCTQESVYFWLPPLLSSPEYGIVTVLFDPKMYKSKLLVAPILYQIQLREEGDEWTTYITKKYPELDYTIADNLISERLTGLRDGVLYQVRVLLMDADFNKYDGDLVGISKIVTKCDIPEEYNYKLTYESDTSSLNFSWSYISPVNSRWCPLERYEVLWKEDWQWLTEYTDDANLSLTDISSGSTIQLKVRAQTSGGFSPFSETVTASTRLVGLSSVTSLSAESRKSSSVEVSWEPPRGSGSKQLRYTVSYKCLDRPACSPGCQTASEGQQSVQDTHINLSPLLPFTQYKVTVTPEDGQPASVYVGTTDVVPTEVPKLSAQKPVRTNTSLTVFWDEVPVCSGFFLGYNYQLTKDSENLKILESGFTNNNRATFHNLTASTQYVVKVFISTIAGWNPDSFLTINVSTSATVPEAVRNLTVYKRGRGMLGLRWAEPRANYGQLKSFTVTHSLGQEVISHTVEPSYCVVWPDLYCHTVEGLRSNRRYNVSVCARNSEVAEDGEVVFVNAVTKESPPTAPEELKVTNMSCTSIELQWNHPEMANGIVRSFLIGVEETEKHDQDSCCQIYPFVETLVKEELRTYTAEVSGLHPASTYFVSVSAKTVGLGPSQSLVVSTRPPHLPLTSLPRVQTPEISWLPQDKLPEVNNSDIYASLVRANLLLAVLNGNQSIQFAAKSGITDTKLHSLLQQKIGKPFYFIAEYNQDDDVELSGPLEDGGSTWGQPPASLSPEVGYQLVAAQVLEYNGVYNVDLRYSHLFTLTN